MLRRYSPVLRGIIVDDDNLNLSITKSGTCSALYMVVRHVEYVQLWHGSKDLKHLFPKNFYDLWQMRICGILPPQALRGDYVRGRALRGRCSWQALGHRPPFVVGCCKWSYEETFGWGIMLKLKGEIILTIKSCYWLGNVKRMKIGKTGKLAEARDVVVGEVQVGQSHQVRETLGENM